MNYSIIEQVIIENGISKNKYYYTYTNNNKKVRKICKNCKTRKEAELFISKIKILNNEQNLIKNVIKDMYIPNSKHYIRLQEFGKKLSERTLAQKRYFLKLIENRWGDCHIDKIKIKDIEQYLLDDKKHSGSWKNFYLETFGNVFEETKWKCCEPVVKPQFNRFIRNSKKPSILSTQELYDFFKENLWNEYRDYLLFLVVASCGLRLGEARALRVEQFLFEDKMLVVDGFCLRNGERTNYNKKGSSEDSKLRVVPVPFSTLNLLKKYIQGKNLGPKDFIFTRENNVPLRQEYLEKIFKRILIKSKIEKEDRKLVPHSLRFTYVTRMRRNVDVEQVRKIVGHSSIEMTEYYTRVAIPEMVNSLKGLLPAANMIFQ